MDRDQDSLLLLADVARLLRTEADRRARAHGLTRAQWIILDRVDRAPGLSQRELAEFLEVEPITVGRLVDRLEARGVVERRPDPDDRRIWRLHLLPPAAAILAELEVQRSELRAMIFGGLTEAEVRAAAQALRRMKQNLLAQRRAPSAEPDESGWTDPPAGLATGVAGQGGR